MARHVIVEHRGCGYGCFMTFIVLIAAAFLIAALPYVGAAAAGFGLYFLMRPNWRQYVEQRPQTPLAVWGMKFAPITRKLMAALVCCTLSVSLMAAFAATAGTATQESCSRETQEQPESGDRPSENQKAERQDTVRTAYLPDRASTSAPGSAASA